MILTLRWSNYYEILHSALRILALRNSLPQLSSNAIILLEDKLKNISFSFAIRGLNYFWKWIKEPLLVSSKVQFCDLCIYVIGQNFLKRVIQIFISFRNVYRSLKNKTYFQKSWAKGEQRSYWETWYYN